MESPEPKRKKFYTKKEALEKLDNCEQNVSKAVSEMVADLSPFDVTDDNITSFEDRLDRLEKVSASLTAKVYKLKKDISARKFKHKPELLEEEMISCSQHSVLQSEDSEVLSLSFSQQSLEDRHSVYR